MTTERRTHANPTEARELVDELEEEAEAAAADQDPATSGHEDFAPDVQDAGEPPD